MNGIPETKTCYDDFVERSVRSNRIILRIGAAFGVLMEFVNIFRVLILTDHTLSTLNNLIYFSLYLVYFPGICCLTFTTYIVRAQSDISRLSRRFSCFQAS